MGNKKHPTIQHCWGWRFQYIDEDREAKPLHTFSPYGSPGCETCLSKDSKEDCQNAAGKYIRYEDYKKKFNVLTSQGIDTALSFSTDAWTSPNNKAYVAITVHFEKKGLPICLLLDIVEVPCSHTGVNLAIAFAQVLEDFGIAEKVSYSNFLIKKIKSLTIQVRSLV